MRARFDIESALSKYGIVPTDDKLYALNDIETALE